MAMALGEAKGEVRGVLNRCALHDAHAHCGVVADAVPCVFIRPAGRDAHNVQVDLPGVVFADTGIAAARAMDDGEAQPVPQHLVRAGRLRHRRVLHGGAQFAC